MNKQLEYLTPEVNVFTVQTEGVIMTVSGGGGITGITEDNFGDLDNFIQP